MQKTSKGKLLLSLLLAVTFTFAISGCVEHRYYHHYHHHSPEYYHRHHMPPPPGVEMDVHVHN